MNLHEFLIVCPLVFLAGFVDAIAGGGGLISLPAYMFAGIPVHHAIATNKLSSATGTAVSTWHLVKSKCVDICLVPGTEACAFVGSIAGANLALIISDKVLKTVLVFVLPVVAFCVLRDKDLKPVIPEGFTRKKQYLIMAACSFVIGIYDGFYGPGTGTFLIIAFTVFAHLNIQTANAQAKVINLTTNLTALAIFLYNGQGVLSLGLASAACNMLGGYIGAGLVMKNGSKIARPSIIFVLFLLALKALGVY
mgnify:CR=1 FL=1